MQNMLGLKSYQTARKMIDGIEAMYTIRLSHRVPAVDRKVAIRI
ncbi:hypothetical protein [Bacillus thuringiensis]